MTTGVDVARGGRWRQGEVDDWRPTAALVRSTVIAAVLVGAAVVAGRADLLVIGTPFAIVTVWSAMTRPSRTPTIEHRTGNPVVREGDATTWRVRVDDVDHVDVVTATLADEPWLETDPSSGTAVGRGTELTLVVRSLRWGDRLLAPLRVSAISPWGAFHARATTSHTTLVTLPHTPGFDVAAPNRPTRGLVGIDRSTHRGEGSEFAAVRAFGPGDRIRRINWIRSLRTDDLQVDATFADHDVHVELVVDATADHGPSGGLDGVASSLDTTVRAAAAITQHYVQRGDRVSLRAFGSSGVHTVRAAPGWKQQRRILETLSALRPAGRANVARHPVEVRPWPVGDAGLTVMLSPLISRPALDRAVQLGRRGVPVVVIDTLPDGLTFDDDPLAELAWRLRKLERRREIRMVERAGIPVVHWVGAGSIDRFLRDVARRRAAPRMRAS